MPPTAELLSTRMAVSLISDTLVARYAAGPPTPKVNQAKSLREDVDEALGYDYRVFLQGSYRNNTGVADLNDVDIVALATTVHSTVGRGPAQYPVSWDEIFSRVENRLNAHHRFRGRVSRGDKCVKVDTDLALDVVPAIYRDDPDTDPIEVFSFREGSRRDNYPRVHWENGVTKNDRLHTDGAYKPTVRLFKRWARNVLSDPKVAPSFYIECAVHHVPDKEFFLDLPLSFLAVGLYLTQDITRNTVVNSVAGDKDILVHGEWHPDNFEQFQRELMPSVVLVSRAMKATTSTEANRLWRQAFGE
jgi:hypothetical protein